VLYLQWTQPLGPFTVNNNVSTVVQQAIHITQILNYPGARILILDPLEYPNSLRWPGAQVFSNSTFLAPLGLTFVDAYSPSVALDHYWTLYFADVVNEPISSWLGHVNVLQKNALGQIQLNEGSAVFANRRGYPPGVFAPGPWQSAQSQIYVSFTTPQEHPTMAGFPAEDVDLNKNEAHGQIVWNNQDNIFIAKSYPSSFPLQFGGSVIRQAFWPMNLSIPGLQSRRIGIEPHVSFSRYQTRDRYGPANIPALLHRDRIPIGPAVNLYGVRGSSVQMGKLGIVNSTDSAAAYPGVVIGVDTLAVGALIGDARVISGSDTTPVVMHATWANEIAHAGLAGLPDADTITRSEAFPLPHNAFLDISAYLLADTSTLSAFVERSEEVVFNVELIDSSTGMLLMPLCAIRVGNHHPLLGLPFDHLTALYSGPPRSAAQVRIRTEVNGGTDSSTTVRVLALHTMGPMVNTFGKLIARQAGAIPIIDAMEIYPNPTNGSVGLHYKITHSGNVRLVVRDLAGRTVMESPARNLSAGYYGLVLDGSNLISGTYWAEMLIDDLPTARGSFTRQK
jgi:hypothetical protein